MTVYDASADKTHKMTQETFDFVMECIDQYVNATQDHEGFICEHIEKLILEKTEISG